MFGFGKSKKIKEFEERIETLIKLVQLWELSAVITKTIGLNEEQKVMAALFFDCIVTMVFNDFGKDAENHALSIILEINGLEISESDINMARYLAQGLGDECAIKVVERAEEAITQVNSGEVDGFALNSILTDDSLKFDTESFAQGILVANQSPSAYRRPE